MSDYFSEYRSWLDNLAQAVVGDVALEREFLDYEEGLRNEDLEDPDFLPVPEEFRSRVEAELEAVYGEPVAVKITNGYIQARSLSSMRL